MFYFFDMLVDITTNRDRTKFIFRGKKTFNQVQLNQIHIILWSCFAVLNRERIVITEHTHRNTIHMKSSTINHVRKRTRVVIFNTNEKENIDNIRFHNSLIKRFYFIAN